MSYETLRIEDQEGVRIVSLNRPQYFNTFSSQMALELNAALEGAEADETVRAVIVRGEGKVFSTGIDISEFPDKSPSEYQEWISLMDRMHFTIAGMGKPVIASAHGYAVANGAGLLLAADFALITETTKIGTTAINVGLLCTGPIIPASYGLGKKKTLELLLCGEMITADQALDLGLVNRVVPEEKLAEESMAFARNLMKKSPLALGLGKGFYYKMIDLPFAQRFAYNSEVFARLCTSEDAKEGVAAFREKRRPQWKGK